MEEESPERCPHAGLGTWGDYAALGSRFRPATLKMLAKNSPGGLSGVEERVLFSHPVFKFNKRGVQQRRVLLVTTLAVYNLKQSQLGALSCKRRIALGAVARIVTNEASGQFVVNVPSEYDYHFSCARQREAVDAIIRQAQEVGGHMVAELRVASPELQSFVRTKLQSGPFHTTQAQSPAVMKAAATKSDASSEPAITVRDFQVLKAGAVRVMLQFMLVLETGRRPVRENHKLMSFDEATEVRQALLNGSLGEQIIGKGSFARVMLVKKLTGSDAGNMYAMKVLVKADVVKRKSTVHTMAERKLLSAMQHPFLVGLMYAFHTQNKLYLVLEYLQGGDMFFHLKLHSRFSEERARLYAAELVLAIGHLHAHGIVYRDLKPENILLDSEGHIRVADFGLAKQCGRDGTTTTFCGTPEYLAPEVLCAEAYGRAVDWWSLGTVLFEMITGLPPFFDENLHQMYKNILTAPLTFPGALVSPPAASLLKGLLDRNAHTRLGSSARDFEDIKDHVFFAGLDWSRLMRKRVDMPYKPMALDPEDVGNFEASYTCQQVPDALHSPAVMSVQKDLFRGFTYASCTPIPKSRLCQLTS